MTRWRNGLEASGSSARLVDRENGGFRGLMTMRASVAVWQLCQPLRDRRASWDNQRSQ